MLLAYQWRAAHLQLRPAWPLCAVSQPRNFALRDASFVLAGKVYPYLIPQVTAKDDPAFLPHRV
jgi:hypothetical protein